MFKNVVLLANITIILLFLLVNESNGSFSGKPVRPSRDGKKLIARHVVRDVLVLLEDVLLRLRELAASLKKPDRKRPTTTTTTTTTTSRPVGPDYYDYQDYDDPRPPKNFKPKPANNGHGKNSDKNGSPRKLADDDVKPYGSQQNENYDYGEWVQRDLYDEPLKSRSWKTPEAII